MLAPIKSPNEAAQGSQHTKRNQTAFNLQKRQTSAKELEIGARTVCIFFNSVDKRMQAERILQYSLNQFPPFNIHIMTKKGNTRQITEKQKYANQNGVRSKTEPKNSSWISPTREVQSRPGNEFKL